MYVCERGIEAKRERGEKVCVYAFVKKTKWQRKKDRGNVYVCMCV